MSGSTINLGLTSYNSAADAATVTVYDYIDQVSGSLSSQNLGIIDTFAGETSASITAISGSLSSVESKVNNTKSAVIQVVSPDVDVSGSSTGIFYMRTPSELNTMVFSRLQGFVNTAQVSGSDLTIQVRNMTKYPSNDVLTVPITIVSGSVVGIPGTVDVDYDDVATDDQIRILVTSGALIVPKGLQVVLEWAYV